MPTIKILIADDHAIIRRGLKEILEEAPGMVVTGEATNGQEVLAKIEKQDFDVVMLDITMPGRSGLDILKDLKHTRPGLPVIVLTVHPEEQYAVRIMKEGAAGYLTKESAPEELVMALKRVSSGRKYITPSLAEKLAFALDVDAEKPLHETLSNREYQVLRLIASGKKVKEVAEELCLSEKTISTYRFRTLQKMGLKNSAQLIRYAFKHNLVD